MPNNKRSRKWCFTLNNYTDTTYGRVKDFGDSSQCRWMIIGKEKGENGTPHLQGALYLGAGKTLRALKSKIGVPSLHLETMKGLFSHNKTYCSKEGDFVEIGVIPMDPKNKGEKEKERWKNVWSHLEEGKDIDKLDDKQILITHYKKLEHITAKLKNKGANKRLLPGDLECHWLYGEPGTGKTRAVWDTYDDENLYVKGANKWWDHYQGEDTVLIDDVDPSFIKDNFMLIKQWADIYPYAAEVKGGTLKRIRPRRIIMTSNSAMTDVFTNGGDDERALLRRFKSYHFTHGVTVYP